MTSKNIILRGAFWLTAAGIGGRIIGFFYRIFLSRTIGAEGLGIYQLVFPLYALTFSLTASGIQTCISRFVSAKTAAGDRRGAIVVFQIGLCLSLGLSLLTSCFLLKFHNVLAVSFVQEARSSDLLRILAMAVPFASVHACINGYYFGLKRTGIPAIGQILEDCVRLGAVAILYTLWRERGIPITPSLAVYGIAIEEFIAALFAATALTLHFSGQPAPGRAHFSRSHYARELISLSTPLTLNRVLVNLLQSLEALLIPFQLRLSGISPSDALSFYGVLTGMALPLILFPTAITSSFSTMLLPAVSEAQAIQNREQIVRMVEKTCFYCLLLGGICWAGFFTLGAFLGTFLFESAAAGVFIRSMSWICPLLYLNPALFAILNGLGLTGRVFLHNVIGVLIRILFILCAIPRFGISGYFFGLLAAQLVLFLLSFSTLKKKLC